MDGTDAPKEASEEGSKEMWVSRSSLEEMKEFFFQASAALTKLGGVFKSLKTDVSKLLPQTKA